MSTFKPLTSPTKRLALAIASTDTSFKVGDILGWDGNALTSANFGTIGFVVLRNSQNTLMEIATFDPTTIASASITFLTRGLDFNGGGSAVTVNKLNWPANDTLIDFGSDPPQMFTYYANLSIAQTVNAVWLFASGATPQITDAPIANTDAVNKLYADTHGGTAANYDQNIINGVAGENLTAAQVVYLKSSDGKWYVADQGTNSKAIGVQLGIVQGTVSSGAACTVLIGGVDKTQTGLTVGSDYYLGSSGAIATTAGATNEVFIGRVDNVTTRLIFAPLFSKAFLGNDTSIKLGNSNKVVTQTGFQKGAELYVLDSSVSANTITATYSPVPAAYVTGMTLRVKVANATTGATTINVNALGAKTVKKYASGAQADLATNDVLANQIIELVYDGTNFLLLSAFANIPSTSVRAVVTSTYDASTASGNKTIAHNLGKTPTYVRITAHLGFAATVQEHSDGAWDGTRTQSSWWMFNTAGTNRNGVDTTNIVVIDGNNGNDTQKATITVDGTNVTLAFTKAGTPTGTINLLVETMA